LIAEESIGNLLHTKKGYGIGCVLIGIESGILKSLERIFTYAEEIVISYC